jgi:hypothetical protein
MVARERLTDERSATAKAELEAIVARRPDLKGKSLEAIRRIMRRETRMSLRPLKIISLIANSHATAKPPRRPGGRTKRRAAALGRCGSGPSPREER